MAAPFFTAGCLINKAFFSSGFFAFNVFPTGLPLLLLGLSFSPPDLLTLFSEEDDPSESDELESLPEELDEDVDEFELLVDVDSELVTLWKFDITHMIVYPCISRFFFTTWKMRFHN